MAVDKYGTDQDSYFRNRITLLNNLSQCLVFKSGCVSLITHCTSYYVQTIAQMWPSDRGKSITLNLVSRILGGEQ